MHLRKFIVCVLIIFVSSSAFISAFAAEFSGTTDDKGSDTAVIGDFKNSEPDVTKGLTGSAKDEKTKTPKDPKDSEITSLASTSAKVSGAGSNGSNGNLGNSKSMFPGTDSNTGALIYNFHIETPPGRNGIEPSLNLKYNSQDVDQSSILGLGWSLDIPFISRLNKNGSDKLFSSYNFSYSLDGELATSDNVSYRARSDSGDFRKYSFSNNVWTVVDKVGTQYKFGSNDTERQDKPGDINKVFKWMLQEVRDKNDNFVRYEYYKDSGQIYPSKIYYTGSGSADGVFEIVFLRQARADKIKNARSGFLVTSNYRINEIQTKVNGSWVRKYELGYTVGDQSAQSVLQTISQTGKDDSGSTITLPASSFNYQIPLPSGNGFAYNSSWTVPIDLKEGVQIADVNGDGLNDLVQSFQGGGTNNVQRTYLNTGASWVLSNNFVPPSGLFFIDSNFRDLGVRLADVNGDSLPDFVFRNAWDSAIYINNGMGWTLNSTWNVPMPFVEQHYYDLGTRVVDVNGDGFIDFAQATGNPGSVSYDFRINHGTGWSYNETWASPVDFTKGVVFSDINNDGLVDILQSYMPGGGYPSQKGVYLNNGYGWTLDPSYSIPGYFLVEGNANSDPGLRVEDVNGDGLSDMFSSASCFGTSSVGYLNIGSNWGSATSVWRSPVSFIYCNNTSDTGVRMADVNDDGLPDILAYGNGLYINQAKKANLLNSISYPQGGNTTVVYKSSASYRSGTVLLNPNLPFKLDTVSQLTHNSGSGSYSESYKYESGRFYFDNSKLFDHKFSGFEKISQTDGAGNVNTTFYHQGNVTNYEKGEWDDAYVKIGLPYRTEVTDSSGTIYNVTTNQWSRRNLGYNYSVKLAQKIDFIYDGQSTHKDKAETYDYDETKGNLIRKTSWGEVIGSDNGTFTDTGSDKFVTNISYATDGSYVIGLPSQQTTVDQSNSKVQESRFYYDNSGLGIVSTGNITKKEDWKSRSSYVNTQISYNSFGLPISSTDRRGKVTYFTYDPYNLYSAAVVNPLNQETRYTYDYSSGKVIQTTDPNGRVFQSIYDGLDRIVEEKQPDLSTPSNLVTKTTYVYNGLSSVTQNSHLDGNIIAYSNVNFDGLGRKLSTNTEAEGNLETLTTYSYNNRGLLQQESLPYFSNNSAPGFISYSYDLLERVTSTSNNLGTTTSTYAQWKLTVTDANGKTQDLYKDAYGNLIRVDEHNSGNIYTTIYEYNYSGNLIKIIDALGNVRNFSYDALGRRLSAEDLHAVDDATFGSWSYSYDDAGNLIEKVDPKNQIVNYTYDDMSRVLTEDYTGQAGIEVSYSYDSGTDGKGRLTGVTTGTLTQTHDYNPLGGLKSESKTIDSTTYITVHDYDRQGNQIAITNPDGSQVKYIYNSAGLLDKVQRKESMDSGFADVVSNFDFAPNGQLALISYVNGATTVNNYDPTKLYRLTSKVTTIAAGLHAQDLTYTYDAVGNITRIVDASATDTSKTADYTYDDLYRLIQATITGVDNGQSSYTESYSYNPIGNILSKSGQGNYVYDGNTGSNYANPHAVTSIGSTNFTYDQNGNLLTKGSELTNTWDYNNRLTQSTVSAGSVTYDYDGGGQRIKYFNGATTTYYPSEFYNTDGTNAQKHIQALGMEVGVINGTGNNATVRYVHTDHLTGSNIITNSANVTDEVLDYHPFGEIRIDSGSFNSQRKFTGYEFDVDTGLNYAGARYYSPTIARFISQDSEFWNLSPQYFTDPQQWNSYSYARNNPLAYVDFDGNLPQWFIGTVNYLDARSPMHYFFDASTDKMINGYQAGNWGMVGQGAKEITLTTSNIIATSLEVGMTAGTVYAGLAGVGAVKVATSGRSKQINQLVKTLDKISKSGIKANKPAKLVEEFGDIIPTKRQNHILNGDETGGGHLFGTNKGKPEFPKEWSPKDIFKNAADVATDPKYAWIQQPKNGNFIVHGTKNGLNISVVIDKTKSFIISTFPKIK